MRKEEFLKQLEYLLQDIPDEDKEEALSYYRDYLDEAGDENEEKTIEEFGSPERIAALIRAEVSGRLKDGGSFTEKGYEDERFRDPNYQVAKRLDLPGEKEAADGDSQKAGGETAGGWKFFSGKQPSGRGPFRDKFVKSKMTGADGGQKREPWTSRPLKIVLWIILLIVASPFLLGAFGVSAGALAGILCLAFGAILVLLVLTGTAFVLGVAGAVLGGICLVTAPLDALFLFGTALVGIGCGLIGAVILFLIFQFFLLVCRGIKQLACKISKKQEGDHQA